MSPKKVLSFALGPMGGALIGLLTVPVLTWYFDPVAIGKFSMIPIIITFASLFFSFGLDQAYVREYYETNDKINLFKVAVFPGLIFIILTSLFLLYSSSYLPWMIFELHSTKLNALILIIIISSFVTRFISLYFRMNEYGILYSLSQLLPKLIFLFLVILFITYNYNEGIYTLTFAYAVSSLLPCLLFAIKSKDLKISISEKLNVDELKGMLKFGLPLAIGSFGFWGLTSIDRILLRYLSNYEELAVYSVSLSFSAAAGIIQSIFTAVWIPIAYKWIKDGIRSEKINDVTHFVLFIVVIVFCLIGLLSWVISYLLPEAYSNVQWIIIASIGYPLFYTLSETTSIGINISRKSIFSMIAVFISFVINVLLNFLLIPIYGATGAALSSCVSFLLMFLIKTEFSIYVWEKIPRAKLYIYPLTLTLGVILSNLLVDELKYFSYIYWLVVLISAVGFFRKEIRLTIIFSTKYLKKNVKDNYL